MHNSEKFLERLLYINIKILTRARKIHDLKGLISDFRCYDYVSDILSVIRVQVVAGHDVQRASDKNFTRIILWV